MITESYFICFPIVLGFFHSMETVVQRILIDNLPHGRDLQKKKNAKQYSTHIIRKLKQQRRGRLRKRHLKKEFALPQTLSRLFQDCIEVEEKKKEKCCFVLCSHPRQNVKLGTFML